MNIADCKIAVFSDLHLGVHVNSPTWHEISLEWAKWFANDLLDRDIKTVVFCGDFFHNRSEITVNTLHHASTILELFRNFNIIMIAGNHDSFYKHNSTINSIKIFNGHKNITVIDEPTVAKLSNKSAFFSPWGTDIENISECDIVFGHFEIESFKMNAHKICDHGFKTTDLLEKAKLIISGHFHLREERHYDRGKILYVGSPFELDFGDAGTTKGYYILDTNDLTYEFIENTVSPKHQKISLSEIMKLTNFNEQAPQLLANNIVKLYIDKTIKSEDLDKLSIKLNNFKPLNLIFDNVVDYNKFGLNQQDIDLSGVDIVKAISDFVDMLDIQNQKDVKEYTISLYNHCK